MLLQIAFPVSVTKGRGESGQELVTVTRKKDLHGPYPSTSNSSSWINGVTPACGLSQAPLSRKDHKVLRICSSWVLFMLWRWQVFLMLSTETDNKGQPWYCYPSCLCAGRQRGCRGLDVSQSHKVTHKLLSQLDKYISHHSPLQQVYTNSHFQPHIQRRYEA